MSLSFSKSKSSDLAEIEELATKYERLISKDFLAQVNALNSPESIKIIKTFLEDGDIAGALDYLDSQDDNSTFFPLFLQVYLTTATFYVSVVSQSILRLRRQYYPFAIPLNSLGFDPTDPKAAETVRNIGVQVLQDLAARRRETMLQIINQGLIDGKSPKDITLLIEKFSGLTVKQIEAILNYEKGLRANAKETLNRALRDKSMDSRVQTGKALTEKQIEAMVEAYRKKMLIYRAEVLGRTIAGDLINNAITDAVKQALAKADIPESDMVKEWRSMRDKRVRFTHKQHVGLDGQIVGINEYFVSPSGARLLHPHDGSAPIKETANCRCRMLIYVRPEDRA